MSVRAMLQLSDQILQVSDPDWSHLVLVQPVLRALQLLPVPALLPQLLLAAVLVDRPGLRQVSLQLLRQHGRPVGVQRGVAGVDRVSQAAPSGRGRVTESLERTVSDTSVIILSLTEHSVRKKFSNFSFNLNY